MESTSLRPPLSPFSRWRGGGGSGVRSSCIRYEWQAYRREEPCPGILPKNYSNFPIPDEIEDHYEDNIYPWRSCEETSSVVLPQQRSIHTSLMESSKIQNSKLPPNREYELSAIWLCAAPYLLGQKESQLKGWEAVTGASPPLFSLAIKSSRPDLLSLNGSKPVNNQITTTL